jgi:DNA-binding GntR family transcriptional regulator
MLNGALVAGLPIPPLQQLADEHGVSLSTVHRAVSLLKDWALVEVHRGRRTLVRPFRASTAAAVRRRTASGRTVGAPSYST